MALPLKWTFSVLAYYEYFDPYFTHINFLQQKIGAVYIRVNTTKILYQLQPLTKKTLSSCRCPGTMLASSVWTSGMKPSTKSSWTSPVTKSDQCVPLLSFSVSFWKFLADWNGGKSSCNIFYSGFLKNCIFVITKHWLCCFCLWRVIFMKWTIKFEPTYKLIRYNKDNHNKEILKTCNN